MAKFKPQVTVITAESRRRYTNNWAPTPYEHIQYPTYARLKQMLKKHLKENIEPEVSVVRCKYDSGWGEYCEYNERWVLRGSKLVKVYESFS